MEDDVEKDNETIERFEKAIISDILETDRRKKEDAKAYQEESKKKNKTVEPIR